MVQSTKRIGKLIDNIHELTDKIRELNAQIEHLKITRFDAKRECHQIKTSLSWRLTWPLRVVGDACEGFLARSKRRLSSRFPVSPPVEAALALTDAVPGAHEVETWATEQLIDEKLSLGLANLNETKETVLVVSHEISRTGAPILVLNLARAFRQKYNVIVVALEGGALQSEFLHVGNLMIGPLTPKQRTPDFLSALFREIQTRAPLKFAIVNTIVAGPTLNPLWENDIAIVHLIHEFASYTRPRGQFRASAYFASERVFPALIVREAALKETPDDTAKPGIVLPQGICIAPPSGADIEIRAREREEIRFHLRPIGCA